MSCVAKTIYKFLETFRITVELVISFLISTGSVAVSFKGNARFARKSLKGSTITLINSALDLDFADNTENQWVWNRAFQSVNRLSGF